MTSSGDLPPADIPEQIRRAGLRRAQSAIYTQGANTLHVQKYEMAAAASGLDLEQTWRPAPSTVAFHRDSFFYVVRWEGDRAAVTSFTRELLK